MKLSSWIFAAALAAAAGVAAFQTVSAQPAAPVPAAAPASGAADPKTTPGHDTYERLCSGCHEAFLVEGQRHTRQEWSDIAHTMLDRGMVASEPELEQVIDYLAKALPPES